MSLPDWSPKKSSIFFLGSVWPGLVGTVFRENIVIWSRIFNIAIIGFPTFRNLFHVRAFSTLSKDTLTSKTEVFQTPSATH